MYMCHRKIYMIEEYEFEKLFIWIEVLGGFVGLKM